ncbi:class I SAM-dependent DNA methyltransferase [Anianabacter salinae]|uniref:class I SAM-dependent DNA methyltransferase n=1 Tax=Anianabacter salinae TaxID=2851023 RepID=UPI00225E686A|nr:methyltransferase domain-containing protein [Anianabacter salinae]MBV0912044.1 methyltransferase domain-containing protein [Anianabacter salinae]
MAKSYFDKVYAADTAEETRALYDDWAGKYDADLQEHGYVTPERVAKALAKHLDDKSLPILDFGCGTGLSGTALKAEGFTRIDGADLSSEMLEEAHEKGVYRKLRQVGNGAKMPCMQGDYAAVAAAGVIGAGAAPASVFDKLMGILAPGGLLAFSFNDHTLQDESYTDKLSNCIKSGKAKILFQEHGEHVPGIDLGATVYVLEKL